MYKYLEYEVESLENLKFAKSNSQIESEETLSYIPGSAIRGAFIYNYIRNNNIEDINTGEDREKLLKGGVQFLNAYPVYENQRSMPFPKCYFAPKEELRLSKDSLQLEMGIDKSLPPGYEKVRKAEFVGYIDNEFKKIDIKKESNLHINKRKEKNLLYRYESITRGQKFKGIIKVEKPEYLEDIMEFLNNKILFLGGSKGSGYGKSRILNMKEVQINPEPINLNNKLKNTGELYLVAMSDIIYKNHKGQYKMLIDEKFISKHLGVDNLSYVDSSIETVDITNFNNKWNCRTPMIKSIASGSVFKYSYNGELDYDKIENFMDKGIGERKLDGYGRFILLDSLESISLYDSEFDKEIFDIQKSVDRLKREEKTKLEGILKEINKTRINNSISERVLKESKKIRYENEMKKSQWGFFKDLFLDMSYDNMEQGIIKFKNHKEHIKQKQGISYTQLNRVKYNDGNIMTLFDSIVNSSMDVKKFSKENKENIIQIKGLKTDLDKKFVYKYNIKLLEEICRFYIRKEEE